MLSGGAKARPVDHGIYFPLEFPRVIFSCVSYASARKSNSKVLATLISLRPARHNNGLVDDPSLLYVRLVLTILQEQQLQINKDMPIKRIVAI